MDPDAAVGADAARVTLVVGGEGPTSLIGIATSLGTFTILQAEVK